MNRWTHVLILLALMITLIISDDVFASQKRTIRLVVKEKSGNAKILQLYDKMVAVIIGVNVYQNLPAKDHLKNAVRDARGIEKVLRERYNFSRIITLYNRDATREKIIKVLQGELSTLGSDDAALIYYAGHGITRSTQQGKLGFLVPYDGSLEGSEMYKNISMQQIKHDISPLIPAKHVLFVIDACFGGLLLGQRAAGLAPSHDMAYLKEITREQVRQIITAGGEDEEVLDGGLYGHSVFTGRLIDALKKNKEYITAKELGVALVKKVYGDAVAIGHRQRPQEGKMYGTGDFVFVLDSEKLQRGTNSEVAALEADMKKLQRLKKQAAQRRNEAELRKIERERLLKESALKQARLRQEASCREAELQRKMEEEALKDASERKRREKERVQRLAYLKTQTEKMLKELGSPADALGLKDAMEEVRRLNRIVAKLQSDYEAELARQLKPVRDYYRQKIEKNEDIPRDKIFETAADYRARVEKAESKARAFGRERKEKISSIKTRVYADLEEQLKPLLEQKKGITNQEFPIGHMDIKWNFGKYYPEDESFGFTSKVNNINIEGRINIPKKEAKEYYYHPELLVAIATVKVLHDGTIVPFEFILQGTDKSLYQADLISILTEDKLSKTEDKLSKMVIDYYNKKGEWAGIFTIDYIAKIRIEFINRNKKNIHVKYKYKPVPGNRKGRTDTGFDQRVFVIDFISGKYRVVKMGRHNSAQF